MQDYYFDDRHLFTFFLIFPQINFRFGYSWESFNLCHHAEWLCTLAAEEWWYTIYTHKITTSVCLSANRHFYALLSCPADYKRLWEMYQACLLGSSYRNPSTGSFKKCKKHPIFSPFLTRNHTAGSCAYMRTTTKTPRPATAPSRAAVRDAHRQALHAAQQHEKLIAQACCQEIAREPFLSVKPVFCVNYDKRLHKINK